MSSVAVTALAVNPSYQPTETLPEIQDLGTKLDLSEWKIRKPVRIKETGVIKLDLDLETLAGADTNLRDLRLVRDGKQQPYMLASKTHEAVSTVGHPNRDERRSR